MNSTIRPGKVFATAAETYAANRVVVRGGGLKNSLLRYGAHNAVTLAAGLTTAAFGNILEGAGIVALGLLVSSGLLAGKGIKSSQRRAQAVQAFVQIDPASTEEVARAAIALHNLARVPHNRPAATALQGAMETKGPVELLKTFTAARQEISLSSGSEAVSDFFEQGGAQSSYVLPPSEMHQ
jgi:hypothetical protein